MYTELREFGPCAVMRHRDTLGSAIRQHGTIFSSIKSDRSTDYALSTACARKYEHHQHGAAMAWCRVQALRRSCASRRLPVSQSPVISLQLKSGAARSPSHRTHRCVSGAPRDWCTMALLPAPQYHRWRIHQPCRPLLRSSGQTSLSTIG